MLELLDYWQGHPPLHLAVGALMGGAVPAKSATPRAVTRGSTDYGAFLGELAMAGVAIPPGVMVQ